MQNNTSLPTPQLQIVHAWIAAFNAHEVTAIAALYAEDAELFDSGMKRPRRGRGEIERWFSTRFSSMPTISYRPTGPLLQHSAQAPLQLALPWTSSGRGPRLLGQPWLARPFQVDGISLFTLQDDQIIRQRGYYDHLAVVEQILPPLRWLLPSRF